MTNNYSQIEKISNEGYDLEFGTVLEKAFENYKKIAGIAGLAMIVVCVCFAVIFGGIIGVTYGFSDFVGTMTNLQPQFMSGSTLIIFVFLSAIIGGVFSPINAGFIKMAHLAEVNQDFGIQTLFDYYKGTYFKELFIAAIVIAFVSTGLNYLLEFMGIRFIGMIITYLVAFLTFLTVPLIIFYNLKAIQAITISAKLVLKQPILLFGLLIISIIFIMLGIIGFCIGIFFTIPFIYSMYYCIYKEILPINEKNELDEIGNLQS